MPLPVVTAERSSDPQPAEARGVERVFPEDVSLWESITLRCRGLAEDLALPEQRWPLMLVGALTALLMLYPLPDEATRYLLGPLQTMATMVSTYAIQTLGIDAIREGNQIVVGEMHLGVVDACSGLRMLTIFIALSVAIVMLGDLEWYEILVILASAIPIALAVNAIRITLTGAMYTINPDIAEKIFHDWAGYFMMPLALGMLYVVQQLLSKLFVAEEMALASVVPLGTKVTGTKVTGAKVTGTTVDGDGRHRPSGRSLVSPVIQAEIHQSGRESAASGHGNDG